MCWFWNLKQLHAQNQGSDSFFELESSFLSYTRLMIACLKMRGNRSCCYLSLMVQLQRYDMKGSCEWHEDGLHNCYVLKYASVMITARGVGVMRYLRLKMSNSASFTFVGFCENREVERGNAIGHNPEKGWKLQIHFYASFLWKGQAQFYFHLFSSPYLFIIHKTKGAFLWEIPFHEKINGILAKKAEYCFWF